MHTMRNAKDLHADLKKTASLELLHQQQVEAEEQQPRIAAAEGGLGAAVKTRLNLGKKHRRGQTLLHRPFLHL